MTNYDLVKQYETIPPYEMMKINIIKNVDAINELIAELYKMKFSNKKNKFVITTLKARTIAFYMMMRPKLLTASSIHAENYKKLVEYADVFIFKPSIMKIDDSIAIFNALNQFCEEDKITSTRIFTGTAVYRKGRSVYSP